MRFTLEVVTVPVADLGRSVAFYADRVGFGLDFRIGDAFAQLTPPGSGCSIQVRPATSMPPGSLVGLQLVVHDVVAARDELVSRGVDVSEVQVFTAAGPRPARAGDELDNVGICGFADPDGNGWVVQQISDRPA